MDIKYYKYDKIFIHHLNSLDGLSSSRALLDKKELKLLDFAASLNLAKKLQSKEGTYFEILKYFNGKSLSDKFWASKKKVKKTPEKALGSLLGGAIGESFPKPLKEINIERIKGIYKEICSLENPQDKLSEIIKDYSKLMHTALIGITMKELPKSSLNKVFSLAMLSSDTDSPKDALTYALFAGIIYKLSLLFYAKSIQKIEELIASTLKDLKSIYNKEYEKEIAKLKCLTEKAADLSSSDIEDKDAIMQIEENLGIQDAFAVAIYCTLKYRKDFKKAINTAVNHSVNTNCTASITGYIMGLIYGISRIPCLILPIFQQEL